MQLFGPYSVDPGLRPVHAGGATGCWDRGHHDASAHQWCLACRRSTRPLVRRWPRPMPRPSPCRVSQIPQRWSKELLANCLSSTGRSKTPTTGCRPFPQPPVGQDHRVAAWHGPRTGCGICGHHRRRPACVRHRRSSGLIRRIGPRTKGFRPRHRHLHRPKRYNRRLRRVFYMAALSSLKVDGPSRRFYDRKRGERLTHTQALLALARRLGDVLWAMLRDGREFSFNAPDSGRSCRLTRSLRVESGIPWRALCASCAARTSWLLKPDRRGNRGRTGCLSGHAIQLAPRLRRHGQLTPPKSSRSCVSRTPD
jgi:hypothetical protein